MRGKNRKWSISRPASSPSKKRMGYLAVKKSMDTKVFEDYQQEIANWQKKYLDIWLETIPTTVGKNSLNFSENFDKALKFQEEVVKTSLEAQEKTAQMLIEIQRQFWNSYVDLLQKMPTMMETQRQVLNNYFDMMQKTPTVVEAQRQVLNNYFDMMQKTPVSSAITPVSSVN
jgi:ATP-dependent Clp protease ATP-binding subunit ClpA